MVEQIHRAGVEFAQAHAASDALGMARAARLRAPLDRIPLALGELGPEIPVMTAARMFAAAHAAAGDDPALHAAISRLEAAAAPGLLGGRLPLEGLSGAIGGKTPPQLVGPSIPTPRDGPAGAFYRIASRASLTLRAPVAAERTLFVLVEVSGGESVVLRVVDESSAHICVDAKSHGRLLCRWRPGKAATGVVVVDNQGTGPVSILLIAHQ